MNYTMKKRRQAQDRKLQSVRSKGLDRITVSPAVDLLELTVLADRFGTIVPVIRSFLVAYAIPVVVIGEREYCNILTLDKILYYLTRQGGSGFNSGPIKMMTDAIAEKTPVALSTEDYAVLESAKFEKEWTTQTSGNPLNRAKRLTGLSRKPAPIHLPDSEPAPCAPQPSFPQELK